MYQNVLVCVAATLKMYVKIYRMAVTAAKYKEKWSAIIDRQIRSPYYRLRDLGLYFTSTCEAKD